MTVAPIISIDGHVKAPRVAYRDYLDPQLRDAFDDWAAAQTTNGTRDAGNISDALPDESQWDVTRRLSDLETQGVVAEVLFPNGVPFQLNAFEDAGRAPSPELTRAGQLAYNRWLADFCSQAPERFAGQALIYFDDVAQAVRDIQWAKDNGLGGFLMPGLYPGGTFFFDPVLDPIWDAIQETGLPISQHGGSGVPQYAPKGMAAILTLAYEHAFFSGRSLWQMIVGGVFDRFPALTVVYVETELHWIGPALRQFDRRMTAGDEWTEFAQAMLRDAAFSRLPSTYWDTNCFAGISPFSPKQLPVEKLGSGYEAQPGEFTIRASRSMFGVDYPHFESIYPHTTDQVRCLIEEPTVTEEDLHRLLYRNAAEVYGFDLGALAPVIHRAAQELNRA
jgi:predicted TIM-barrel fold metal-dependent hydrolase